MEEHAGTNIRQPSSPRYNVASPTASPTASPMQQNMATTSLSVSESVMDPIPWTPTPNFFYGTLMDPELLQSVLELSEPPQLQPGTISGFKIMLWVIYPGLVRAERREGCGNSMDPLAFELL